MVSIKFGSEWLTLAECHHNYFEQEKQNWLDELRNKKHEWTDASQTVDEAALYHARMCVEIEFRPALQDAAEQGKVFVWCSKSEVRQLGSETFARSSLRSIHDDGKHVSLAFGTIGSGTFGTDGNQVRDNQECLEKYGDLFGKHVILKVKDLKPPLIRKVQRVNLPKEQTLTNLLLEIMKSGGRFTKGDLKGVIAFAGLDPSCFSVIWEQLTRKHPSLENQGRPRKDTRVGLRELEKRWSENENEN